LKQFKRDRRNLIFLVFPSLILGVTQLTTDSLMTFQVKFEYPGTINDVAVALQGTWFAVSLIIASIIFDEQSLNLRLKGVRKLM